MTGVEKTERIGRGLIWWMMIVGVSLALAPSQNPLIRLYQAHLAE